MASLSISSILNLTEGKLLQGDPHAEIRHLVLDTRSLPPGKGTCFFAIKGPHHDGHRYVINAVEMQMESVVIEYPETLLPEGINAILVNNTIHALQQIAAHHRDQYTYPVVAITGSNGKTIVKDWIVQLLSPQMKIVSSPKSYNSQIGVPLSLWRMESSHELAVIEAGISQKGEMKRLESMIHPNIGVFTNLGTAHADGFVDEEEKLREKLLLFQDADQLVYCKDQPPVHDMISSITGLETYPWSTLDPNAPFYYQLFTTDSETLVKVSGHGEATTFVLPFTDEKLLENALHAATLVQVLKPAISLKELSWSELKLPELRLEIRKGLHHSNLILDCYNADISSLSLAVNFLDHHRTGGKTTLILSDFAEQEKNKEEIQSAIQKLLVQHRIDQLIMVGNAMSEMRDELNLPGVAIYGFTDTDQLLNSLANIDISHHTVLIKGARKFTLEAVGKALEEKSHRTRLEINLEALTHNLNTFRQVLHPEVRIMAMVKASSYGAGSVEIAKTLEFQQIDYLGVAYADEGIELRKAGITVPIMVMNTDNEETERLLQYRLEPVIFSLAQLSRFEEACRRLGAVMPIHLKVDTGMHRLGIQEHEINHLTNVLRTTKGLILRSVFTHLAVSEDLAQDEFTHTQVITFDNIVGQLKHFVETPFLVHIVNSASAIRFPDQQRDMVRLGIGLYGVAPVREWADKLLPVATLKASISQIKELNAGESIGYGRAFVADKKMRSATISIGYADGIPRKLGNGNGQVGLHGELAPIIGNICMDMLMIDISKIPQTQEGDEVVVFGDNPGLAEVADWAETIPYEILAGLSARIKRVYFE